MGVLSNIATGISSWFASHNKVVYAKYILKQKGKEHKVFISNQWNRLFFFFFYKSLSFLRSFEQSNDWKEIPENIDEYRFCGCYEYREVKIEIKKEQYNLFQIKDQNIRIMPLLYPIFLKQLKKAIKKGWII